MNDAVYPPKPRVAESTFRFTPREDITAYELALIVGTIYSKIENVTLADELAASDPTWLEIERHFTKLETVDSPR